MYGSLVSVFTLFRNIALKILDVNNFTLICPFKIMVKFQYWQPQQPHCCINFFSWLSGFPPLVPLLCGNISACIAAE
jgi:hypothetical protein